jgi:hypothetical protein
VYFPCALRRLCALHLELFALPSVSARFGSRFHLGGEDGNLVVFLQQITIAKLHDNQWSLFLAVKWLFFKTISYRFHDGLIIALQQAIRTRTFF